MQIRHPYHEGELAVQRRVGEDDLARHNGSAISDTIIRGALPFIEQQPMGVFGSVDGVNNVWASLLVGEGGLLNAVDERTVELDLPKLGYNRHDPLWANIEASPRVGVLLIEFATRRNPTTRVSWIGQETSRNKSLDDASLCPSRGRSPERGSVREIPAQ